ncbi:MAG: hypothetical protein QMD13_09665 [Candidatus Bathyarchaeia archaeon]|nr:hypothetical protein [Candidatus Bathyarchaeia archaeon]
MRWLSLISVMRLEGLGDHQFIKIRGFNRDRVVGRQRGNGEASASNIQRRVTGKVQLGRNQISYGITKFSPNLPSIYSSVGFPTLTYIIQIVHEHMSPKINALNVICIPNGKLLKYYGSKILQAGKGGWKKATDIRYKYIAEPRFLLLSKKHNKDIFRIEILLLDKNFSVKQLTGKYLPITPYKII